MKTQRAIIDELPEARKEARQGKGKCMRSSPSLGVIHDFPGGPPPFPLHTACAIMLSTCIARSFGFLIDNNRETSSGSCFPERIFLLSLPRVRLSAPVCNLSPRTKNALIFCSNYAISRSFFRTTAVPSFYYCFALEIYFFPNFVNHWTKWCYFIASTIISRCLKRFRNCILSIKLNRRLIIIKDYLNIWKAAFPQRHRRLGTL